MTFNSMKQTIGSIEPQCSSRFVLLTKSKKNSGDSGNFYKWRSEVANPVDFGTTWMTILDSNTSDWISRPAVLYWPYSAWHLQPSVLQINRIWRNGQTGHNFHHHATRTLQWFSHTSESWSVLSPLWEETNLYTSSRRANESKRIYS